MRRGAGVALGAWLAQACASTGADTTTPIEVEGRTGRPLAGAIVDNLMAIPVSLNGHAEPSFIVDTGSPVVVIDPSLVPTAGASGSGTLTLGALTFTSAPFVTDAVPQGPGQPFGGILGCTVICRFRTAIDYRTATFTLGDAELPAGVEPAPTSIDFSLEGGGLARLNDDSDIEIPASRVIVTATIEGHDHAVLFDTGASIIALSSSLYAGLIADGRHTFDGLQTATLSGTTTASVARLHSLRLGAATVEGPAATSDADVDRLLAEVSTEVDHPVEGLVGATFLREFFVAVDYPRGRVDLHAYTTKGTTADEFVRVGVAIDASQQRASGAVIGAVFAGTDAQKQGLRVGDVITSIDGKDLAGLASSAVDVLLEGSPGASRTLVLAGENGAAPTTIRVRVDDLIALE